MASTTAASSLPQPAATAAQNALNAALADSLADNRQDGSDGEDGGESGEGQEVSSMNPLELSDVVRTVFDDPTTFNVKHPLYSPWTLWFDSPATKAKGGVPSTPISAVSPATPLPAQAAGWMDDIKKVISFDSVEEFWGLYNNIIPPSQLPQKANYYLFKEGIIPAWEDAANKDGGKWSIQLPRDKNRANIDKMWLYTMLAAIGETFDPCLANPSREAEFSPPPSLITGVIVSTRPQFYRLSIWTRLSPGATSGAAQGGKSLTSNGFGPAATVHPSEEGEKLRERIEGVGKHFKTGVLGYPEAAKLAGPLATEVEFVSHRDSEKKGRAQKKWVV